MNIDMTKFSGKCSCGRDHQLTVKEIILEKGALQRIPEILGKEPYITYHSGL